MQHINLTSVMQIIQFNCYLLMLAHSTGVKWYGCERSNIIASLSTVNDPEGLKEQYANTSVPLAEDKYNVEMHNILTSNNFVFVIEY